MDAQTLMNITQQLAVGLLDSCKIFFLTLLFSMPLGHVKMGAAEIPCAPNTG